MPPRTGFLKLSILISNVSHSGCDYVLLLLHLLLQPPLQKLPYQILRSWTCSSGLYVYIDSDHVRQSLIHALRIYPIQVSSMFAVLRKYFFHAQGRPNLQLFSHLYWLLFTTIFVLLVRIEMNWKKIMFHNVAIGKKNHAPQIHNR